MSRVASVRPKSQMRDETKARERPTSLEPEGVHDAMRPLVLDQLGTSWGPKGNSNGDSNGDRNNNTNMHISITLTVTMTFCFFSGCT